MQHIETYMICSVMQYRIGSKSSNFYHFPSSLCIFTMNIKRFEHNSELICGTTAVESDGIKRLTPTYAIKAISDSTDRINHHGQKNI